ncbi:hypothetical protein [Flavobacterium davisii]|uniref:restriction endonuclease subunit S n=1 Tax=Flavobacterium davisii TaxID=2906077 RepID=UPI0035D10465
MLERLETKEVNFSEVFNNKDFRVDTDFWTKEPKLNPKLKYDLIGNCLINAQYGISLSMNEDNKGYPIYRMNEIHNMLCDFEVNKYADITSSELETFKLNNGDVLFNRTNSYEWVGRTGIYYKQDDRDFIFASYLVRFIPNQNKILPEYLSAFLNSKIGVWDVKRRSRQSINQTNVNPEEVKQIKIPLLGMLFQNKIRDNFVLASGKLRKSIELYTQAETLLLQEIGFDEAKGYESCGHEEPLEPQSGAHNVNMKGIASNPDKMTTSMVAKTGIEPNVNVKSFKESFGITGRLDAEYYQKKYEQYEELVTKNKKGYSYIKNEFELIKTIAKKDKLGYNYIEIGDVNVGDGLCSFNYILSEDLPANAKTIVKKGDILISNVRPYRGAVTIIDFEIDDLIVSGAFTVLREKENTKFSNEVLKVLLRTSTYKDWLLKFNVGTSYPVIKDEDVLNLPIPFISEDTKKNITKKIQESQNLKKQSEQLLEIAKKAVEIAIEENEEVAMAFINTNTI